MTDPGDMMVIREYLSGVGYPADDWSDEECIRVGCICANACETIANFPPGDTNSYVDSSHFRRHMEVTDRLFPDGSDSSTFVDHMRRIGRYRPLHYYSLPDGLDSALERCVAAQREIEKAKSIEFEDKDSLEAKMAVKALSMLWTAMGLESSGGFVPNHSARMDAYVEFAKKLFGDDYPEFEVLL